MTPEANITVAPLASSGLNIQGRQLWRLFITLGFESIAWGRRHCTHGSTSKPELSLPVASWMSFGPMRLTQAGCCVVSKNIVSTVNNGGWSAVMQTVLLLQLRRKLFECMGFCWPFDLKHKYEVVQNKWKDMKSSGSFKARSQSCWEPVVGVKGPSWKPCYLDELEFAMELIGNMYHPAQGPQKTWLSIVNQKDYTFDCWLTELIVLQSHHFYSTSDVNYICKCVYIMVYLTLSANGRCIKEGNIWNVMLNVLSSCLSVSADSLTIGLAVGLTLLAVIIIGAIAFVLLKRKRAAR